MITTSLTGAEIKALRKEYGLTQRGCAEIVGIGIRQWQKFEEGNQKCKKLYIDVLKRHMEEK
jgi:transcriptional regulator with XRE-family HTH domain